MKRFMGKASLFVAAGVIALTGATAAAASASDSDRTNNSALLTIKVSDEQYKVRTSDPEVIRRAEELMKHGPTDGGENIPHGAIVKEPSADNPGYAWHIDPSEFFFSEVSTKGCDEGPSGLGPGNVAWEIGYLCPWSGEVTNIEH